MKQIVSYPFFVVSRYLQRRPNKFLPSHSRHSPSERMNL